MLTTPHTTAGIALGAVIGSPLAVIPAALASHFLLDTAPHWQETLAPYMPNVDTLVVLLPALKRGLIQKFWDWHCRIQRETSSLLGLLPQAAVVTASVLIAAAW